ncbi:hypothetical protein ACPPVV_11640 [Rhodanobacter sp. Col0626]|uniref:hypothetical protein n=1 Tax=Rhodanobacter sp. Col0626 TaxID=3415679 RepID=UPI003CEDFCAC
MTQTIDPIKLKAAAEHLDWVLRKYPDSEEVQDLLHSLSPLIDDAKAARVLEPVEMDDVPGAYNFGDGVYMPYTSPSVDDAYTKFRIEMRGGLTEQEKRIIARMEAATSESKP